MFDLLILWALIILAFVLMLGPRAALLELFEPLRLYADKWWVMHLVGTGVNKRVYYKVESAWNTAPGATGAQALRRVTSNLDLKKETFESNEMVTHLQRVDYRHGLGHVEGTLNGELSPGTYKDFMAAAVRRAWAAVTPSTSVTLTIAGSGPTYTVTRSAGSWLSDNYKVGHIIRLSVGVLNAANISKNLLIVDVTSPTVISVMPLNGVALVAEGPIATCTITAIGKTTYIPISGHTDLSYAIEHFHSDLTLSELYTGLKIDQMDIAMPPSGMATIGIKFIGGGLTTAGAGYYTSPTVETSTGILAAVNGIVAVQGAKAATLTGLNFNIKGNMSGEATIGSTAFADIAEGRVLVEGSFTALFDSVAMRDYFINETEISLIGALSTSAAAAADFIAFSMPRVKVGGADKADAEKSLVQTFPFTALYNSAGGSGVKTEQTTLAFQDSQA